MHLHTIPTNRVYRLYEYSAPLRTWTCYIRDIFVLFLQDYCALQELLMKWISQ